jgi:hypothetical protein
VCLAGIVDKAIPVYGGEMMITKVRGLPSYAGADISYAASLPVTNQPGEAFHLYPVDSIDLPLALPAEKKLSCADTFDKVGLKKPGDFKVAWCPGDCGMEGNLSGTNIFNVSSAVCRAADHAAVVGSEGGHVVVTRGHGQPYFFGSKSGNVSAGASTDAPGANESYTVSLPVPDFMARVVKKDSTSIARPKEEAAQDTSQMGNGELKEACMIDPSVLALLAQPQRPRSGRQRQLARFL